MTVTSQADFNALERELQTLRGQLATTQARLEETEAILQAIRSGEVDAMIVSTQQGEQVFTLQGADYIYQCLVEQMGEGAATVAEDGLILYGNQELARLLDCPLNNIIGSHFNRFIAPLDQKKFTLLLQNIQNKEILTQELSLITASTKQEVPVKISLKQIAVNDLIVNSLIITDITDSKIREVAKISQILDGAIIVIKNFRLFPDGRLEIDDWLGGTQAIFGYSLEEIKSSASLIDDDIFPEDQEKLLISLREDIQAGRPGMVAYRFWHQDGTMRWLSSNYIAEWNGEQNCWQGIDIITDITQRKQLEQQFYHAQRLESLGNLASGIAHDFNNILTPIVGASQLLNIKFSQPDSQTQKLLALLTKSSERAVNLVKQILFFSQGRETEYVCLHLENILEEVINVAQQTFPKSIQILKNIPPDNLAVISGDGTQMQQVFMNLLINARDAMPEGGLLSVRAKNRRLDEPFTRIYSQGKVGDYVEVEVKDTGTGIDPNILERIFDPFFTTKEAGKGTGLGLSTVMGILKSHGGFVLVSSQPDHGTIFEVFLPASKEFFSTPSPILPPRRGQGELILIVDDEESVREITQASLENNHYRTLLAQDGQTAIDLYREHQAEIQVVLMDMMMPNMTGAEAMQGLQKINPQVKIIATSGLFSNKALAAAVGVEDFLLKPYAIAQLLQILDRLLVPEASVDGPHPSELTNNFSSTAPILSRPALEGLSPDWLRKMYDAAYCLDADEMLALITKMPNSHQAIGQTLKELILDFNTEIILELTSPWSQDKKVEQT